MKRRSLILECMAIGMMIGTASFAALQFELTIGASLGSLIGSAIGGILKMDNGNEEKRK